MKVKLKGTSKWKEKIVRCDVMHKTCYPNKKNVLDYINKRKKEGSELLYPYKCEHCHYWHVTRSPQD